MSGLTSSSKIESFKQDRKCEARFNFFNFWALRECGRSKRGWTQKHANDRKKARMSRAERKRKSAKGRQRAQTQTRKRTQKNAKGLKRAQKSTSA